MDITALDIFSSSDLTGKLSEIESFIEGKTVKECSAHFQEHNVHGDTLSAARNIKKLAAQIDVKIHALGILLCLPELLEPDEIIESVSLGAGNTGKKFDLKTNLRVAEFKFINWQGGPESIRQNSLFKDFYGLAEDTSERSKYLYVLGTKFPLKFFNSRRSLESVLSKDVSLHKEFRGKYPDLKVVSEYFLPKIDLVEIKDVSSWLKWSEQ
ncbi:MAG: hypothetical protein ACOYL3_06875 [Desulfuromonadaceae bacterium]